MYISNGSCIFSILNVFWQHWGKLVLCAPCMISRLAYIEISTLNKLEQIHIPHVGKPDDKNMSRCCLQTGVGIHFVCNIWVKYYKVQEQVLTYIDHNIAHCESCCPLTCKHRIYQKMRQHHGSCPLNELWCPKRPGHRHLTEDCHCQQAWCHLCSSHIQFISSQ